MKYLNKDPKELAPENDPFFDKEEYWFQDPARVTIVEYNPTTPYFFEGRALDVSTEYLVGYTEHLERKLNNPRFMNNAREEVIDKVKKELEFVKNIK